MSDTQPALNRAITDAIADAGHDGDATDDVFACLIAGIGLLIAFRAFARPDEADRLCEIASVQIVEAAASHAGLLADVREG